MKLKIFIVFFCALFTGGHSLKCYECLGKMGSCESVKETTCMGTDRCSSTTEFTGGSGVKNHYKGCAVKGNCLSGSVNNGDVRTVISKECCTTDLCNSNDAPDYGSNSPNGKQCYYCDGKSCFNKLNCLGDEDTCFKDTVTNGSVSQTYKGCVSKSICDVTLQATADSTSFSCCKGNLCNGAKSVTQNLLFLLWPLFFYILIQ